MADIKSKFGASGQTLTMTLANLANYSARQSAEVDNSANLFLDALLVLKIKSGASGVSSAGVVNIYAYGSVDGGTTRTEGAGASDAAITLANPTNLRLLGAMNMVANATTYISGPMSVANAFGGQLPERWGIVVENRSGAPFDTTEGNHAKLWQGILGQTV